MEVATRRREQEVWQACDDLWALHGDIKIITGDEIRERLIALGKSRGSPNEIYKYRKTWQKSRGINANDMVDAISDDPITRAARLVHEQLKSEADRHIETLTADFNDRLAHKDEEVKKARGSLESVMVEFSSIEQKLKAVTLENASLQQQIAAEIDIRAATEREVSKQREMLEREKQSGDRRALELKSIFDGELNKYQAREQNLLDRINNMLEEAKQAGYQYSEHLIALKTELKNQEILMQRSEQRSALKDETIAKLTNEIETLTEHTQRLREERAGLLSEIAAKNHELALRDRERQDLLIDQRKLRLAIRRSEISLARLRAIFSAQEGRRDNQPR